VLTVHGQAGAPAPARCAEPDNRHAGHTLTAEAGANLRELMERMGHTSTRAALIYLHSTSERQHTLADTVGKLARAQMRQVRKRADDGVSGPKGAGRRGPRKRARQIRKYGC
jgi:hypothetical protein